MSVLPKPSSPKSGVTLETSIAEVDGKGDAISRKRYVGVGVALSAIALVVGFGLPRVTDVEPLLTNSYYQFTWVLVVIFASAGALFWQSQAELSVALRRRVALSAGAGVLGATMAFAACEREFRILADEANLLGLSMSLSFDRTYRNILEGSWFYDNYHPSVYSIDPRPALHPFLVSLLHDFTGYRPDNAFVLNFAAAAGAIGLVCYIGATFGGWLGGLVSASLLLANTIFALGATSAGFEPLNLFFVTLTLWCVYGFLNEPTSRRMVLMVLAATATGHCRYESILVVLPVGAALWLRWKNLRLDSYAWLALAAPLLFIPYAWQRHLHALYHEVDASKPVFSPLYLWPNVRTFFRFALERDGSGYPMNRWLGCLAVAGLTLVVNFLWKERRRWREADVAGVALGFGGVGLIFLLHMTNWVVDYRTVAVQRYAISYASAMALLAAVPLWFLGEGAWRRHVVLGVTAFVLSHGLAKAGENTQGRWLTLYREYKQNLAFLEKWPKEGTMFIADRPGMYAVHQYGAMSFESANKNPESVNDGLRRKLTPNTFVEQRIYYEKPGKPEPALSDKIALEPVHEYQNDAHYYVRISRVTLPPQVASASDRP